MTSKLSADIEEIKSSNPFYEKYSEKLNKAQAAAEKKEKTTKKVAAVKKVVPATSADR